VSKKSARVEAVTTWARERGGEFTGAEAAEALGMKQQGVGPVLAGMVRRGEATVRDDTASGRRVYTLA
jgi:DNA-binding MarR family transcriptional regulator